MKFREPKISNDKLIGAVIFVLLAVALAPTVYNQSATLANTVGVTSASGALAGLITVVYIAATLIATVKLMGIA